MKERLAVALLPMLLAGCGAEAAQGADDDRRPQGPPRVTGLSYDSDVRSAGTVDVFTSTGGSPTPEAAASGLAKPGGDVVVQGQTEFRAAAYLLRSDGTAYSRLDLIVLQDGTWRVDGMESCSGEEPFRK